MCKLRIICLIGLLPLLLVSGKAEADSTDKITVQVPWKTEQVSKSSGALLHCELRDASCTVIANRFVVLTSNLNVKNIQVETLEFSGKTVNLAVEVVCSLSVNGVAAKETSAKDFPGKQACSETAGRPDIFNTPISCTANTDCPNSDFICKGGKCQLVSPKPCYSTSDCPHGYICTGAGNCRSPIPGGPPLQPN